MTKQEHLIATLAEECNEVAQRCTKALRFGLTEVQPGQAKNNADRIVAEYVDLMAVWEMLIQHRMVNMPLDLTARIEEKKLRVLHFMEYARDVSGVLEQGLT